VVVSFKFIALTFAAREKRREKVDPHLVAWLKIAVLTDFGSLLVPGEARTAAS